ncbi:hypothetical protein SUS17_2782 [Sphingomonas sp. S17]|nr:hypothetical protein SUS17_2782 [Sphingomonas sp. S17]
MPIGRLILHSGSVRIKNHHGSIPMLATKMRIICDHRA